MAITNIESTIQPESFVDLPVEATNPILTLILGEGARTDQPLSTPNLTVVAPVSIPAPHYNPYHLRALSELIGAEVTAVSADNVEVWRMGSDGIEHFLFRGMQMLLTRRTELDSQRSVYMEEELFVDNDGYRTSLAELALQGIGRQAQDKSDARGVLHQVEHRCHAEMFWG